LMSIFIFERPGSVPVALARLPVDVPLSLHPPPLTHHPSPTTVALQSGNNARTVPSYHSSHGNQQDSFTL